MSDMRLLVLGSCALFLCLPGYCQKELKADLVSAQRNADSLTAHLLQLTEETHEPARGALGMFARDLVHALGSRTVDPAAASRAAAEIAGVMKSAGTSTADFLDRVANFEAALVAMGADRMSARRLAQQLEIIGKQVRGPEDTPVHPAPFRFR